MSFYRQVAKNIYQVTLPLPFALNHVHCYLLDDGDGWTLIDAGLNTQQGRVAWEATFEQLGIAPPDLKRIIVTHTHPDHYGLAGWLQQWGQNGRTAAEAPPVLMTEREATLAVETWIEGEQTKRHMVRHLLHCGLEVGIAREVALNTDFVRRRTRPHPHTIHYLTPGGTLEMGGRAFRALSVPGHSDAQMIFYSAADGLLLSADQVLMQITPNISTWPNTEPDPLGRYLASLRQLKELDVQVALPGHKALITDWRGRLTELEIHHANRLQDTIRAVNGGTTVEVIAKSVFRLKELTVHEARFAITETLAHLDYLVVQGDLHCRGEDVWRYFRN